MLGFLRLLMFGVGSYLAYKYAKKVMGQVDRPYIHRDPETRLKNPSEILGVSANATKEEIKSAYKKTLQQYHPDKVAQMGAEIQKVAKTKTKEIIWAYETLTKR